MHYFLLFFFYSSSPSPGLVSDHIPHFSSSLFLYGLFAHRKTPLKIQVVKDKIFKDKTKKEGYAHLPKGKQKQPLCCNVLGLNIIYTFVPCNKF